MPEASSGCDPDRQTFRLVITMCTYLFEFELGFEIEKRVKRKGLQFDVVFSTGLIALYSKGGDVENARRMFDGMPVRNVVAWNAMISGYSHAGSLLEAMKLYEKMQGIDGIFATEVTLVRLIFSLGIWVCFTMGKLFMHTRLKSGLEANLNVSNSMMAMYIACECLEDADQLFNEMILRDAISWTRYVENEHPHVALSLFQHALKIQGFTRATNLALCGSQACGDLGDYQEGIWSKTKYLVNENGKFDI